MALQVVQGWHDLAPETRGAAVALGNFDGVHLGHRRVIADAARAAGALQAPLGAITFEPHPRAVFHPGGEPFRLMSLGQQARTLDALGVDLFYVLPFDDHLAHFSAEEFARRVLVEGLGARHVAAGFDITFGWGRTGDPAALRLYGERYGFAVSIAEALGDAEAEKYSSSAVRAALGAGRPERAAEILGRPFAIEGVVEEGKRLGRTLGFPTANISAGDYVRPRYGVYAVRARLSDVRVLPGVANFGEHPTAGRGDARLEVCLFDFDEDLYGQTLEIELIAFLRPEQAFDGLEALAAQIKLDAEHARRLLAPTRD